MMFSKISFAALAAVMCFGAFAQAQTYPDKPITVVVGYPPGGSTDLTGRAIATALADKLKATVVVENLGGAGGSIGARKVLSAAPDGYTLLLGANNEIAINPLVSASTKYKWQDFTPVGLVGYTSLMLVASPKAGVKNTDEFLKLVKANPGKFSYGSSGVGTSLHLAGELVKQQAGIFMTHIPYRGVAPLTADLIGNNIEFGVFVLSSGIPHVRSGKVIPLGITDKQRSKAAPDIPSLSEHPALKNIDIGGWFALMAPGKMPEPLLAKIKQAFNEVMQSSEFRKKMEDSGATLAPLNVDMPKFLATETAKYQKLVDFAKIREQ